MSVTEFARLEFVKPNDLFSPNILPLFTKVSELQAAWSGYPLLFYRNINKEDEYFLISGWKDVPAHEAWMKSEQNQGLLKALGSSVGAIDLIHLNIDYDQMPKDLDTLVLKQSSGESEVGKGAGGDNSDWQAIGKDVEGKRDTICHFAGYRAGEEIGTHEGSSILSRVEV